MKNKFSSTYFYVSSIILFTCLSAFPLSAAFEPGSKKKPSVTSNNNVGGYKTESSYQEEGLSKKTLSPEEKNILFDSIKKGT